eukprot:1610001-Pleurochrysis_carterae.AAC.1
MAPCTKYLKNSRLGATCGTASAQEYVHKKPRVVILELVAASAGADSGHLKFAWPVPFAVTGTSGFF